MNEKTSLSSLRSELSQREEALNKCGVEIKYRLMIQNEKIKNLRKTNTFVEYNEPPDNDEDDGTDFSTLIEEYKSISVNPHGVAGLPGRKINQKEARDRIKKFIVNLFPVFDKRLGSIGKLLEMSYKQRMGSKQSEFNQMEKYKGSFMKNDYQSFNNSKADLIVIQQMDLVKKQLEMISLEEELYKEIEFIYSEKEKVMNNVSVLFSN